MKVFCDTNVIVAAFLTNHPHHNAARPILERIKARTDRGFVAAHSIAETFAVLTRLPGSSQVMPGVAWTLISQNIMQSFSVVSLSGSEYAKAVEGASLRNVQGGMIYDALLLAAASKSRADRIYTFNMSHFQSLAGPKLAPKIVAP
jgi:predicted nucleic acid-binding protein